MVMKAISNDENMGVFHNVKMLVVEMLVDRMIYF